MKLFTSTTLGANLHHDIRDAMQLIEFAARGKITIELTLNQLMEQRQALNVNCDEIDQQINETRCKMERAQEHLEQSILNLLHLNRYHDNTNTNR